MFEYRPVWAIPGTDPSVSVLHWDGELADLEAVKTAIRNFFAAIVTAIPNEVTITFPGEVIERDPATGTLVDVHSGASPASVTGTNTGTWIGGAGAVVRWETGAILAGRRLRGRTFIVPLGASFFENNGTLLAAALTLLGNAASTLISDIAGTGSQLRVWSATHGETRTVTSATVPDRSAILRTRRD
ncbi:MAG TPA: hypothetical protein VJQ57_15815 [Acidimicrobiia bacterium]|nr:hypothetical protein [Acidimicrobiia bacterium]